MTKRGNAEVRAWRASVLVAAGVLGPCSQGNAAALMMPTRFTVVDAGTVGKPDVVMIPGLASSRAVWDAEAAKLAPNYRLHLVQVNGFAGQAAGVNATGEILPGVVEELHGYIVANKMHPAVVGHSLGGLLALMLAKAHTEDVSKMVIVDSLPFYSVLFEPAATVETVKPRAEMMKGQVVGMPKEQFEMMAPMSAGQLVNDAEAKKTVTGWTLASDRAVFGEAMYEDMTTDLRADVAKIQTPTLMLYPYDATATADVGKIDAVYQTAYKPMPHVKLVRIDGARHFIMYDQPRKMDEAVEAFFRSRWGAWTSVRQRRKAGLRCRLGMTAWERRIFTERPHLARGFAIKSKVMTTKKELLQTPIQHIDIKQHNVVALVDAMASMAYSSRDLARAANIYEKMLRDTECGVILCLAGSLISAGLQKVIVDLVRNNMVDAIVSTGANIVDQDFFEALGFKHYVAGDEYKYGGGDATLRELMIDRIYDTFIDEEELRICDETTEKIIDSLGAAAILVTRTDPRDGQVPERQRTDAGEG